MGQMVSVWITIFPCHWPLLRLLCPPLSHTGDVSQGNYSMCPLHAVGPFCCQKHGVVGVRAQSPLRWWCFVAVVFCAAVLQLATATGRYQNSNKTKQGSQLVGTGVGVVSRHVWHTSLCGVSIRRWQAGLLGRAVRHRPCCMERGR